MTTEADTYNAAELAAGRITAEHITALASEYQRGNRLVIDGKLGPATRASLVEPTAINLGATIVFIAVAEIGHGESGGNNQGHDIERYCKGTGMDPPIEWCAAFVGYVLQEAHRRLLLPFPIAHRSVGAKKLADQIGGEGSVIINVAHLDPGDVISWHRGAEGSASGHIGIVEYVADGLVHTVEGNTGNYPSKVRRHVHDVSHERVYRLVSLRK